MYVLKYILHYLEINGKITMGDENGKIHKIFLGKIDTIFFKRAKFFNGTLFKFSFVFYKR